MPLMINDPEEISQFSSYLQDSHVHGENRSGDRNLFPACFVEFAGILGVCGY
jgi:hypothetical protein